MVIDKQSKIKKLHNFTNFYMHFNFKFLFGNMLLVYDSSFILPFAICRHYFSNNLNFI